PRNAFDEPCGDPKSAPMIEQLFPKSEKQQFDTGGHWPLPKFLFPLSQFPRLLLFILSSPLLSPPRLVSIVSFNFFSFPSVFSFLNFPPPTLFSSTDKMQVQSSFGFFVMIVAYA